MPEKKIMGVGSIPRATDPASNKFWLSVVQALADRVSARDLPVDLAFSKWSAANSGGYVEDSATVGFAAGWIAALDHTILVLLEIGRKICRENGGKSMGLHEFDGSGSCSCGQTGLTVEKWAEHILSIIRSGTQKKPTNTKRSYAKAKRKPKRAAKKKRSSKKK